MTPTLEHAHRPARRLIRELLLTAAMIALTAVALLWGWNTVAADFGGLPQVQFRHALAPLLVAAAVV